MSLSSSGEMLIYLLIGLIMWANQIQSRMNEQSLNNNESIWRRKSKFWVKEILNHIIYIILDGGAFDQHNFN